MHKTDFVRCWRRRLTPIAILAVLAMPVAAGTVGPITGHTGCGIFEDVKSPPLATSEPFQTTWALHAVGAVSNYAGFLFSLTYDSHEMSFLSVHEVGIHTGGIEYDGGLVSGVTFPGSQSGMEMVLPIAVWIDPSSAMYSGIPLVTSSLVPLFQVVGHAKNTTTAYNSDVDIVASGLYILHNNEAQSGVPVNIDLWVYVNTGLTNWTSVPGQGVWVRASSLTPASTLFIPQSAFYAFSGCAGVAEAGFGIEHVPEPMSMLMLLSGAGALLVGRRRRRT